MIYDQNESYDRIIVDGNEYIFSNLPSSVFFGLFGPFSGFIAGLNGIRVSYFNHNRQKNRVQAAFNILVCEIQR